MKPILRFYMMLLTTILLILVPCSASAGLDGPYTYEVSGGKALITDFQRGYKGGIVIPETLDSYPVIGISYGAFFDCDGLTSVVIGTNVTSIGAGAFSDCALLESIVIGTNVTSIGDGTFAGCTSLTAVAIGLSLTNISFMAFSGCSSLTSVTLPGNINTVGAGAFYQCTSLTNISVATDNPFFSDLEGILCNKGQTAIIAFPGGRVPRTYVTPDGITAIGDAVFAGCTGLTSLVISDSVQVIGYSAFDQCTGLTNVIIGKGVASIGASCFFDTTSLESVYFNATNCTSITTGGLFTYNYDNSVFGSHGRISFGTHITIGKDAVIIPDHLFDPGYFYSDSLAASVVFEQPSSCTAIGEWAFAYNSNLRTMRIPASVREIGKLAFWSCTNLTSMTLPGDIRPDGANYLEAVSILDGSRVIGEGVFAKGEPALDVLGYHIYDPSGIPVQTLFPLLKTVTIPDSVTSIGPKAFMDCTSLSSITIPSGVTSIGYSAFSGCSALASLRLLDSPATIGSEAFMNCTNLSSVILGDKVEAIESLAFYHCLKLPSIIIPSSTKNIASYAFSDCLSLTTVTIPDTVSAVADYAFYNCPAIRTVSLPSSVLPMRRIFSDYQGITSITVGHTSTNIPDYAFADCTSLTSVTLPDHIQTIGYAAFFNCASLWDVSQPAELVSLGDWAFSCCSSLRYMELPNGLRFIGARAFSFCDNLTAIEIPMTVTHIGDLAFAWSQNLTDVFFSGNAPAVGHDIYSASFSDVINHVLPWATGWNSTFAERPVERLAAQLHPPSITPSDGYVFKSSTSIIIDNTTYYIDDYHMQTFPATLRYTLDGSDPTPSSPIYSRFSVTNDTVIKVRFFMQAFSFSEVTTVRVFKGSYNGAMDMRHALNFNAPPAISTNTGWFAQMRITHDGQAAAQSPQIPDDGEARFTIPLTGPGQLSFMWKTSCEKDDTGAMSWDYASVTLDGVEISRLDGETDWLPVSFAVPEGDHDISIIYRKDGVLAAGEDCAWVDSFSFMASSPLQFSMGGESFEVPVSSNFTLNATQQLIDAAVATYSIAYPSATPEDIQTLLSTADAMGLNMGLLGQGTNILLFTPQLTISGIHVSTPSDTPPDQVALSFTVKNGITTPSEAVALLKVSASRKLEILARAQLAGTIATIIPVSTRFSDETVTLTFQLFAAPSEAFFRIRLAHQPDPI